MIDVLIEFGERYALWLLALSALSIVSLLLMGVLGARLIARLPADYFLPNAPHRRSSMLLWVIRNVAGLLLVVAGAAMLVLPGQGLLTILAGLLLMDFPGKRDIERRLLRVRQLRRSVDWLRRRAGQPPLQLHERPADEPH